LKHGEHRFKYHGAVSGVYILGSDLRIAQLLDKLKDNALDFSKDNSEIVFELKQFHDKLELSVMNYGPPVPDGLMDSLFAGMVTSRPDKDSKPHLGIGLFIANRIAQQHGGELIITNLAENRGVRVSIVLPVSS
jgi:signal transduction histidine kinase